MLIVDLGFLLFSCCHFYKPVMSATGDVHTFQEEKGFRKVSTAVSFQNTVIDQALLKMEDMGGWKKIVVTAFPLITMRVGSGPLCRSSELVAPLQKCPNWFRSWEQNTHVAGVPTLICSLCISWFRLVQVFLPGTALLSV